MLAEVRPDHVAFAQRGPRTFAGVLSPSTNLVVWRRRLSAEVRAAAEKLAESDAVVALDRETKVDRVADDLVAGIPGGTWLAPLAADVRDLLARFAAIEPADHYRLRFERVRDDSCRLFHTDFVRLRLICTYHGPGTDWLADRDVVRSALGSPGASVDEINARIIRPGAAPHRLATGWVGVMRGEAWPANGVPCAPALVHRSAPIAGTGLTRIRLSLEACRGHRGS
jgi:hypothetical protein